MFTRDGFVADRKGGFSVGALKRGRVERGLITIESGGIEKFHVIRYVHAKRTMIHEIYEVSMCITLSSDIGSRTIAPECTNYTN